MENFATETGRKFLALAKAGFKVSDLIPDLVFRQEIKSRILKISENFSKENYPEMSRDIDVLTGHLLLASHLGLVKENHFQILRAGFADFKLRVASVAGNPPVKTGKKDTSGLKTKSNDRQEKILEKFRQKGDLKLFEIKNFFPQFSDKTIRNELTALVAKGLISRNGHGVSSFYQLTEKEVR